MKIKAPLRFFIYFSIFLHLLGGALYYYYKNPDISPFSKKEDLPVSENIAPPVKDFTANKEAFSSKIKNIKPPGPEIPKKSPPLPLKTKTEPIEIKSPSTDSLAEQEADFNSEISETIAELPAEKNKNVKIFFGSDNSQSPAEKPNKEKTTDPNLSDEAGFAGHEALSSQEETLPSNNEEINIGAPLKESISPETQEETNPKLETISLDNKEADLNLKELTTPDTLTESPETKINTGKSGAVIPTEEIASSGTQKEEGDTSLNKSEPLTEEPTTSSAPTESSQKETSPDTSSPDDEELDFSAEEATTLDTPTEPAKKETSPDTSSPDDEELDFSAEEATTLDTPTEPAKKEITKGKSSVSFQNFLNLKQRTGNPNLTYPKKARQIKAQGSLSLIFYLTSEGLVEKIQIESSSGHRELDNSVVQTFSRYKFLPNQQGWVRHKVDFRLKGEKVKFLRLREK